MNKDRVIKINSKFRGTETMTVGQAQEKAKRTTDLGYKQKIQNAIEQDKNSGIHLVV